MKRQRSYFLNLFTRETWQQFIDHGANETGFSARQNTKAAKVQPGDLLICYLAGGEKAFIGLLEVKGPSFQGTTRIWSKDMYPTRIPVKMLVSLKDDQLVEIDDVLPKLERFQSLENKARWSIMVRSSLMEFSSNDGHLIAGRIYQAAGTPSSYEPTVEVDTTSVSTLNNKQVINELQRLRQIEPHISRSLFKRMEEEIARRFVGL